MANPEDLDKFRQGPKVWNAWRAESSERVPDLRNARPGLGERQLGPENGGPVNLHEVDLEGVELRNATLIGADLNRARLTAADLVGARLEGADLTGADLTDAVLDGADLEGAMLEGAILIGASFTNARGLTQEQIAGAHGDASTALPGDLMAPESWFPPLEDDLFTGSPAPEPIHNSDPYEVLGAERTASQPEIRTAFRNLVKMYHPDLNPDDAEAQELFKRISIAYRILGDVEKRGRYDRGEIGGDGEISPEFEAKQHFRRYAYRFYAAAAASLIVVVGALASVWYMVLTQEPPASSRLEIAVATPPKQVERLPGAIAYAPEAVQVDALPEPDAEASGRETEPQEALDDASGAPDPAIGETPGRTASTNDRPAPDKPAPTADLVEESRADAAPYETEQSADSDVNAETKATRQPSEMAEAEDAPSPVSKTAAVSRQDTTSSRDSADKPSSAGSAVPSPPATSVAATEAGSGQLARPNVDAELASPEASLQQDRRSIDVAAQAATEEPVTPVRTSAIDPEVPDPSLDSASSDGEASNGSEANASAAAAEDEIAMLPPAESSDLTPPAGHRHDEDDLSDADAARSGDAPAQDGQKSGKDGSGQARTQDVAPATDESAATAVSDEVDRIVLLRTTNGRNIGKDPISELFRRSAIVEALALRNESETTSSIASLFEQDELGEQDEVWDLYTHSRPEPGETENRPWPDMLKTKEKPVLAPPVNQSVVPVPGSVIAERTPGDTRKAPRPAGTATEAREQAVSDILAGGL